MVAGRSSLRDGQKCYVGRDADFAVMEDLPWNSETRIPLKMHRMYGELALALASLRRRPGFTLNSESPKILGPKFVSPAQRRSDRFGEKMVRIRHAKLLYAWGKVWVLLLLRPSLPTQLDSLLDQSLLLRKPINRHPDPSQTTFSQLLPPT